MSQAASLADEIRQVLSQPERQWSTAAELYPHLELAESAEQVAKALYALRQQKQVDARPGSSTSPGGRPTLMYALTGSAPPPETLPERPLAKAPTRPTVPARPAVSAPAASKRRTSGRQPGVVPGNPNAETVTGLAERLGVQRHQVSAAVAAHIVPESRLVFGGASLRLQGIVSTPELDAAIKAHAAQRRARWGKPQAASADASPTTSGLSPRVQIAALIVAGFSHFNHTRAQDENMVRAALRRADLLLSLANQ